jgi:membrane peptidoglycan carboxypeptidase
MKLPHRREKDETRVLQNMGKALGWERSDNNPRITYQQISPNTKKAVITAKPHVNMVREEDEE